MFRWKPQGLPSRMGVRVIYDPAPPSEIPLSCYEAFDIIAPNQSEAEVL